MWYCYWLKSYTNASSKYPSNSNVSTCFNHLNFIGVFCWVLMFFKEMYQALGTVWINLKRIAYPQIWKFLVPFLPARHDASKLPKVVVLKVVVALPSPTCPEGVLPRYHWVNWSGPKSTKWMMGNRTTRPHPQKKGGNSWISNDSSTHINSTIFIYKKYPRILVFLKVYHGVGDLVSINNMQFHRLSWSQLNSFGACYFNCFGALLEAALEVGLGRSATWDLWVIYWKHGHKWNNTRTKNTRKWEKWSSISHRFF